MHAYFAIRSIPVSVFSTFRTRYTTLLTSSVFRVSCVGSANGQRGGNDGKEEASARLLLHVFYLRMNAALVLSRKQCFVARLPEARNRVRVAPNYLIVSHLALRCRRRNLLATIDRKDRIYTHTYIYILFPRFITTIMLQFARYYGRFHWPRSICR